MANREESFEIVPNADECIKKLSDLFNGVFDLDIVQSVAWNYNYDFEAAVKALLEMSSNEVKIEQKKPRISGDFPYLATPSQQANASQMPSQPSDFTPSNRELSGLVNQQPQQKPPLLWGNNLDWKKISASFQNGLLNSETPQSADHQERSKYESMNQTSNAQTIQGQLYAQTLQGQLYPQTSQGRIPHQEKTAKPSIPQNKSKKEMEVERVISLIKCNEVKVLVLMRGLPGSGKSYLARLILKASSLNTRESKHIFSADNFFIRPNGSYEFQAYKLREAHAWVQNKVTVNMAKGVSPIVIDNTNTEMWEMKPYVQMALAYGYQIEVLEPYTHWAFNIGELAKRNTHGVVKEKLIVMKERYAPNVTTPKLLMAFDNKFRENVSPDSSCPEAVESTSREVSTDKENCLGGRNFNSRGDFIFKEAPTSRGEFIFKEASTSKEEFAPKEVVLITKEDSPGHLRNQELLQTDLETNKMNSPSLMKEFCSKDLGINKEFGADISKEVTNFDSPSLRKSVAHYLSKETSTSDQLKVTTSTQEVESLDNLFKTSSQKYGFPNLNLEAWGVNEESLISWDVVVPTSTSAASTSVNVARETSEKPSNNSGGVERKDASSLTESADFSMASLQPDKVKVLFGKPDRISPDGNFVLIRPPMAKLALEKGTMTDESLIKNDRLEELVALFPGVPLDILKDIYEKCGYDVDWAADLLLDDKRVILGVESNSVSAEANTTALESNSTGVESNLKDSKLNSNESNSKDVEPNPKGTELNPDGSELNPNGSEPNPKGSEPTPMEVDTTTDDSESQVDSSQQIFETNPFKFPFILNSVLIKKSRSENNVPNGTPQFGKNQATSSNPNFKNFGDGSSSDSTYNIGFNEPKVLNFNESKISNFDVKRSNFNEEEPSSDPSSNPFAGFKYFKLPNDSTSKGAKPKEPSSSENIKTHLEKVIGFNSGSYSNHVSNLMKLRRGIPEGQFAIPSTSNESKTCNETKSNELNVCTGTSESLEDDDSDPEKSPEPEELIELNLGDDVVTQLEMKFGHDNLIYPKGLQPIIQIPSSFARQLHAFYLESIYRQLDAQKQLFDHITREDEQLARKIQTQEENLAFGARKPQAVVAPNFREIMEEQAKQCRYEKANEKWAEYSPDDLASILTRIKLIKAFPHIDQKVLLEILHAHDNNYEQTLEVLIASSGVPPAPVENLSEPPVSADMVEEMKTARELTLQEDKFNNEMTAKDYREEAEKYMRRREELIQKAKQYYERKQPEVAMFYSDLAKEQTKKYNYATNIAVTAFLEEQHKVINNFDTLDLHYLKTKEAVIALDLYLDENITRLRNSRKGYKNLCIITGRGKNSENGQSKIKPAVISRLKKRNIKFTMLNPGLLRVEIYKATLLTKDLP